MTGRVVLAYSGGTASSAAMAYLAERTGAEVVAVTVDVGQGGERLDVIRRRALDLGAVAAEVVDARDEFAAEYCLPAIRANALYLDARPPVAALSRPLIARHAVAAARRHGGTAVAHGRAAGDDRVRFAAALAALAPDLTVLTVPASGAPSRHPYVVERNLWGRTAPAGNAIDGRYGDTADPAEPGDPDELVLTFDAGVPVAIDGETVTPYQVMRELNRRARAQGVGRLALVEGRPAGRGRGRYEAPGALALITAHRELEAVTVERELARYQRAVERRWGELVHDGRWFSPLKRALDAFLDDAQRPVTGEVRLVLHDGRVTVTDRRAEPVRCDGGIAPVRYGGTAVDQSLATSLAPLHALPGRLMTARNARLGG